MKNKMLFSLTFRKAAVKDVRSMRMMGCIMLTVLSQLMWVPSRKCTIILLPNINMSSYHCWLVAYRTNQQCLKCRLLVYLFKHISATLKQIAWLLEAGKPHTSNLLKSKKHVDWCDASMWYLKAFFYTRGTELFHGIFLDSTRLLYLPSASLEFHCFVSSRLCLIMLPKDYCRAFHFIFQQNWHVYRKCAFIMICAGHYCLSPAS